MYSRDYEDVTVEFEASGGLINSSLVMQDRQTDTYWSMMKGKAIAGELEGNDLVELPVSEKLQWRDWKAKHPDTLVLSIQGREDARSSYRDYFVDPNGFRGQKAQDKRLLTKEPIFAFHHGAVAYAVRQKDIEGGAVYELEDGIYALLLRLRDASMFASTTAYLSKRGFEQIEGDWVAVGSEVPLSETEPLRGFDTFWYNFSLNNPDTKLLR